MKMDCLDGPEVLEGEAILSPPPSGLGLVWIVGILKVSQQEEKSSFAPGVNQSYFSYIIFLIEFRHHQASCHQKYPMATVYAK